MKYVVQESRRVASSAIYQDQMEEVAKPSKIDLACDMPIITVIIGGAHFEPQKGSKRKAMPVD